jgi:hypothetical protein
VITTCQPSLAQIRAFAAMIKELSFSIFTVSFSRSAIIL